MIEIRIIVEGESPKDMNIGIFKRDGEHSAAENLVLDRITNDVTATAMSMIEGGGTVIEHIYDHEDKPKGNP